MTHERTVYTQPEIVDLFCNGIDGKHSHRDNYRSENGIIYHYRTIEGVRTNSGVIIKNSQCWASGFAKCSLWEYKYDMPLTTISNIQGIRDSDLRSIVVVDAGVNYTLLFTIGDIPYRFFITGTDDGNRFVTELKDEAQSIEEAYEQLRPTDNPKAIRQGDLFFVPDDRMEKFYYYTVPQKAHMEVIEPKYGFVNPDGTKKHLVVPEIPNPNDVGNNTRTRHHAHDLAIIEGTIYVKGAITHPQHKKLVLNGWHIVLSNNAKQSWDASGRGYTLGGD